MNRAYITYGSLVLVFVILGALAGWYFFLHSRVVATEVLNAGRGFSTGGAQLDGTTGAEASAQQSTVVARTPAPQLWHVSSTPTAGIGFATSTEGLRVRYVERASGYVFDADPATSVIARVGNTLTPKTYEAQIASGGRVLERSLDQGGIKTFAGVVASSSAALSGSVLPPNLEAAVADPRSNAVAYLIPDGSGVSLVTSAWDGTKQKKVITLPVPGWRLSWLSDGRIILAQKAADSLTGYAFSLKGTALSRLAPPAPGLTVIASATGAVLYATSGDFGVNLFVQPSATTSAVKLPVATIADKCVWSPDAKVAYCAVPQTAVQGAMLDAWYRGDLHTSDAWWRIDARSGQAELFFAPSANVSLDVVNPVMDSRGEYIAFMNNTDLSAWLLRLNK